MKLTVKKLQEAIQNEIKSYLMEQLETKQISDREVYDEDFIEKYDEELQQAFANTVGEAGIKLSLTPEQAAAVNLALLLNKEYGLFYHPDISISNGKLTVPYSQAFINLLDILANNHILTFKLESEYGDIVEVLEAADDVNGIIGDIHDIVTNILDEPFPKRNKIASVLINVEDEYSAEVVEMLLSKVGYEVV